MTQAHQHLPDQVACCMQTHVLWRNLRSSGRAKFQRPGAFRSLGDLAPECQAALDRCAAPPANLLHQ